MLRPGVINLHLAFLCQKYFQSITFVKKLLTL